MFTQALAAICTPAIQKLKFYSKKTHKKKKKYFVYKIFLLSVYFLQFKGIRFIIILMTQYQLKFSNSLLKYVLTS